MNRDLKSIRSAMRTKRLAMPPHENERKSLSLSERIIDSPVFTKSQHIAAYLSDRGEVNTASLIDHALALGKKIYLPVLDIEDHTVMHFMPYCQKDALVKNRFGMPEPLLSQDQIIKGEDLDLALCPLVAFDEHARRIGMGGGFYDRYFAFTQSSSGQEKRPVLVGLAFEFQKVSHIDAQAWDVPMSAIYTEENVYIPRKN